jgi:hypothetical protein
MKEWHFCGKAGEWSCEKGMMNKYFDYRGDC